MQNQILNAAEQKIEGSLTPENRINYNKIVAAGMQTALKSGPQGNIMSGIVKSKQPLEDCVNGAVNLCVLMSKQSRGTAPMKALVPAAMTLLLHALDVLDKSGMMKIGQPELVRATHLFADAICKRSNITKDMLHTAAGKVQSITQDPAQLEKIKRAAGTVKSPDASTPTDMTGAQ